MSYVRIKETIELAVTAQEANSKEAQTSEPFSP